MNKLTASVLMSGHQQLCCPFVTVPLIDIDLQNHSFMGSFVQCAKARQNVMSSENTAPAN